MQNEDGGHLAVFGGNSFIGLLSVLSEYEDARPRFGGERAVLWNSKFSSSVIS